jgi:hypothetical protein
VTTFKKAERKSEARLRVLVEVAAQISKIASKTFEMTEPLH